MPRLLLDSCIFFAYLKGETNSHGPDVINGIKDLFAKAKRREVQLITSVCTLIEIFELEKDQEEKFKDLLNKRYVQIEILTPAIIYLTREIRLYYKNNTPANIKGLDKRTVGALDATHLATAICREADCMYTLDKNNTKEGYGLLQFDGNVMGHSLKIRKPNREYLF